MVAALWAETKDVDLGAVVIKVKHIGTPEDPMLFEKLERRWISVNARIDRDTRKQLALDHGSLEEARASVFPGEEEKTIADAVRFTAYMSESYMDAWSMRVRDLICAGVVDGPSAYVELMNRGGPALLVRAAGEVADFNRPSPKP